MPNIKTAKPIRMSPTCIFTELPEDMRRRMPMTEIIPVSVAVENRLTQPPPPPRSDRQMIQPVILVPRIAPRIMPMAWRTFIMPELTKPTTMTDVADDDWMTAVTPVPSSTPLMGLLVRRYKMTSRRLPATFFRPSPISDMPNRNSAMPLSSAITFEISMPIPLHSTDFTIPA